MPTPTEEREAIVKALRPNANATEEFVQWVASLAILAYDLQERVSRLEAAMEANDDDDHR